METIMTVTDLVRDTCKTASELVKLGNKITVTSGGQALFQIVPTHSTETQMTPRQYKAFLRDLDELAKAPDNPVLRLRRRRHRSRQRAFARAVGLKVLPERVPGEFGS